MLSLLVALAPNFRTFLYEYSIAVVVALCYKVTMLMNFFQATAMVKVFITSWLTELVQLLSILYVYYYMLLHVEWWRIELLRYIY